MVKFSTIIKLFQTSKLYGVLSLKCVHNVLGHLLHSLECKLDESVWSCIDICNYVSREGWSSTSIRVGACFLRSARFYVKPKAPIDCSRQDESEYGLKSSIICVYIVGVRFLQKTKMAWNALIRSILCMCTLGVPFPSEIDISGNTGLVNQMF